MRRILIGFALIAGQARAHTLEQGLGVYGDSQDRQRQRAYVNGTATLRDASVSLMLRQDRQLEPGAAAVSPDGERQESRQDAFSLSSSQTWEKLTETRQSLGASREPSDTVRTGGVGVSRWMWHESLRASVDVGRTVSEQPASEYLDVDHELVELPRRTDATTTDAGLRHLATPTTILDWRAGYTSQSNRPPERRVGFGARQFVRPLAGAVHANVTRHLNVGEITTETSYGQVRATEADVAWLQSLWPEAQARVGYRWYREDETTRATEDELTFGSDTISLGVEQAFRLEKRGALYRLALKGARYQTNAELTARAVELALGAEL